MHEIANGRKIRPEPPRPAIKGQKNLILFKTAGPSDEKKQGILPTGVPPYFFSASREPANGKESSSLFGTGRGGSGGVFVGAGGVSRPALTN